MHGVLRIDEAHKSFGEQPALDGASFELQAGECLALLGPNGAGKTTLIRAVAGRVRLDRGRIDMHGQVLDESAASRTRRTRLGIVPQEVALYSRLTAVENMRAFGVLSGLSPASAAVRADWALAWTGLEQRAHEPIHTFSSGMKRRLNIACGVLHQPEIILLDEPSVGVDPQSRERIWEMLGQLKQEGAALLLTTHQLDEAQRVCDRIVIIDRGRTIAAGTFGELLDQTIGRDRRVLCTLDRDVPTTLLDSGFDRVTVREISRRMQNLADDLPPLLSEIAAAGARVERIRIEEPTLQTVFLFLTGRQLRE